MKKVENQKTIKSDYVQMKWRKKIENDWEEVVKEIVLAIYTKEIKEKKEG